MIIDSSPGRSGIGKKPHLDLAFNGVAACTQRRPCGVGITGQHMNGAIHLSEALDVDAGSAQRLDDSGKLTRAIFRQPYRQVSPHWVGIVEVWAAGPQAAAFCRGTLMPLARRTQVMPG